MHDPIQPKEVKTKKVVDITKAQQKTLKAYSEFKVMHNRAPTYRELGDVMGQSESVVFYSMRHLREKGYVSPDGNPTQTLIERVNDLAKQLSEMSGELEIHRTQMAELKEENASLVRDVKWLKEKVYK